VVLAARPWHSGSMGRGCDLFSAYYSQELARCLLNSVEVEFSYDADIDLVFIDLPVLEQERYRWTLEIVVWAMTCGHRRQRLSSRLSHSELETITICDVHERCVVVSCCIIGMERVCFSMSVFAYSMCFECCIILDNK
jgi:hypothetical protein